MNKIRMALAVFAIVLAAIAPGPVWARGGGHGGGHPGGFAGHHGFVGHPGSVGHDRFDHRHGFVGHGPFRFGVAPFYPYYGYYPYVAPYATSSYWYYCPSYGAYYPSVGTCPEAWVPVVPGS